MDDEILHMPTDAASATIPVPTDDPKDRASITIHVHIHGDTTSPEAVADALIAELSRQRDHISRAAVL